MYFTMKASVLFLLLVYKTIRCEKPAEPKTTLIVPKIPEKCKNIKCSVEEDPKCVRIKHRNANDKVIYVIAYNKCELQYTKCYNDYYAKIVPMKLCGKRHFTEKTTAADMNAKETTASDINTTPLHGRVKRHASKGNNQVKKQASSGDSKRRFFDYTSYEEQAGHKVLVGDIYDDEPKSWTLKGKVRPRLPKSLQGTVADDDYDSGHGEMLADAHEADDEKPSKENNADTGDVNRLASRENAEDGEFMDEDCGRLNPSPLDLFSKETIDKRIKEAENSGEDNNSECPESCPARNLMVCSKNALGIYRTFLSVCHLRMYNCEYPKAEHKLVSRTPCVMGLPFIDNPGELASGKVVYPHDKDHILNYLKCQSMGILDIGDPRCPF